MRSLVKPAARRLWKLLDYAGRGLVAWTIIGALGLAGIVTGLGAWLLLTLDVMPTPILIVLSIGAFLLLTSVVGISAPYLLVRLPAPPPERASAASLPIPAASQKTEEEANLRAVRVAIHDVITSLETHRDLLTNSNFIVRISWGTWADNRDVIAAEPWGAMPYRLTQRAFQAMETFDGTGPDRILDKRLPAVIASVEEAITALEEVLP